MRKHQSGSQHWRIVAVVASVVFVILAVAVASGSSLTTFDRALSNRLVKAASPGAIEVFKTITLLGTGTVLGIASAVVAVALLIGRKVVLAIGWIAAQTGAVLLVKGVKYLVERDRPGLGDTAFYAHGWSFPSGHVVRTCAFFGMAPYVVFRMTRSRRATTITCAIGLCWSLMMALSRLYLGAHFVTDVAGAFMLATAWLAACLAVLERRADELN